VVFRFDAELGNFTADYSKASVASTTRVTRTTEITAAQIAAAQANFAKVDFDNPQSLMKTNVHGETICGGNCSKTVTQNANGT
jgi:hypothetical protein